MYQALYRKYRPRTFSDVVGQEHIVKTLKNQVREGRLSHAYLFTGSRGTGKTSCAKILAKAVNCLAPSDGDPCDECEICRGVNEETLLDVTEIDAASNNGVDSIRELRENTAFTPARARYRVYIIDEVHMLTDSAFNALLKTLEEPPAHVIFILATTEVHKLPATILSRCQRFDFHRIAPAAIADRLRYVAEREGFSLTPEAALLIARTADGGMRDALSLLDVCAGTGRPVTVETAAAAAGLSGRDYLLGLCEAVAQGDSSAALCKIDELYAKSKDLQRLCVELIGQFRDLMLVKAVREPETLFSAPEGDPARLRELAARFSTETLLHAVELLEDTLARMNRGSARRPALETALIKLCDPALDASPAALLRRVSLLEQGLAAGRAARREPPAESAVPAAPPEEPADKSAPDGSAEGSADEPAPDRPAVDEPAPIPSTTDSGASGALTPFSAWPEVLAALGKTNPLLKAVLGGSAAYTRDDLLLIDVSNESFRDMVNSDPRQKSSLKDAVAAVTGRKYRLGPYSRAAAAEEPAEADPLDEIVRIAREKGLTP